MGAGVTRLRDHAYSSFTEKLLSQDIQPGQFLSQRELGEITDMPLGAIREMIPRLEADGLIRTEPKRGLQVLSIDLHLIRDAFQLRAMIEAEAVGRFCETATDGDISSLRDRHLDIQAQVAGGVTDALLAEAQALDWAFHDALVDAMQNRIVSEIYRVNMIKIRLIANSRTRMLPALVGDVMQEHLPIIEALVARDSAAAARAMRDHIDSARRRAMEI